MKRIHLIFGLAGVLFAACAHAQPAARELARDDGSRIRYYLEPRDPARRSDRLLLVIQGSDCNSVTRIRIIQSDLVRAWPQADLLTVEKYGIDDTLPYDGDPERPDCPAAYLERDNLQQRASDLDAVLTELRRTLGYRQVVALGGSEGAVVANLLASRSRNVDATIAFNGGGQWFLNDMLHSLASEPVPAAQRRAAEQGLRSFARHVLASPPQAMNMSGHGHGWWRSVLELDQLATLRQVAGPVLILQGGADASVSPQETLSMVARLRLAGSRNIDYRAYPGLDHAMTGPDGISRMPEVVDDMAAWLRRTLAP